MHEGWRGDVPAELTQGATLVGVAGAKGMRNRVTWTVRKLVQSTAPASSVSEVEANVEKVRGLVLRTEFVKKA